MNNKVLLAGLIGGILYFLLGFLIWGLLLENMMADQMMPGLNRTEDSFQWLWLFIGNLFAGLLYAWILDKANARSFASGATVGAVFALLLALAMDLTMYGVSNIYTSFSGVIVDVIATVVVGVIMGGVIGWWYGRGRKTVMT